MSPLDEARALVGGDGPAAERVAAVVAERDDLRTRLAEAEKDRDAFAARYRDACAERERAEMQRDVARTERDVIEMQLAERDAVLGRIERALGDACTGDLASDVERVVRVATAAERMMTASGATLHVEADELRAAIAAARERETEPLTDEGGAYCLACEGCGECPMTARLCTKCWGTGSAAEQPRADLGETDAGEGE